MPVLHTVLQGEHITQLAVKYGFADYRVIWDHPYNRDLKQRRNPNVLLPGDIVTIPDRQERVEAIATGREHRFILSLSPVKLRLRVLDYFGEPMANTACELTVDGATTPHMTDGEGIVEAEINPTAKTAQLAIGDFKFDVQIGHLDPVEAPTGMLARLHNLGYHAGESSGPEVEIDEELLKFAIELFQWDNALGVDGEPTPNLLRDLQSAFGC